MVVTWQAMMMSEHYRKKKLINFKIRSEFCSWVQSIQVYHILFCLFVWVFWILEVISWYGSSEINTQRLVHNKTSLCTLFCNKCVGSLRSNMINNDFALRNLYHKAATDQHIDLQIKICGGPLHWNYWTQSDQCHLLILLKTP